MHISSKWNPMFSSLEEDSFSWWNLLYYLRHFCSGIFLLADEKYFILRIINNWNLDCKCAIQACTRSFDPKTIPNWYTEMCPRSEIAFMTVPEQEPNLPLPSRLLLFHKLPFGIKFFLNNIYLPLLRLLFSLEKCFSSSCLIINFSAAKLQFIFHSLWEQKDAAPLSTTAKMSTYPLENYSFKVKLD